MDSLEACPIIASSGNEEGCTSRPQTNARAADSERSCKPLALRAGLRAALPLLALLAFAWWQTSSPGLPQSQPSRLETSAKVRMVPTIRAYTEAAGYQQVSAAVPPRQQASSSSSGGASLQPGYDAAEQLPVATAVGPAAVVSADAQGSSASELPAGDATAAAVESTTPPVQDCSSFATLAPAAWDPKPGGNCTSFTKDSKNCDKGCGNCFNPGARVGVKCHGQQPGYNCPSDPSPNGDVAFACMDWTFGSTAQKAAEASYNCRSGKDPVYFGVGTYGTSKDAMGGLGVCVLLDVEGVDRQILAQSINTGFDVAGNQFDLQIGAGGAGAFNTCAGGAGSMYPGSKKVWGEQYGGLSHKENCSSLPLYPRDGVAMKAAGESLVELCEYGFDRGVRHEGGGNPSILSITRVACPAELVALTQLRRSDEPSGDGEQLASRRLAASHKCGKSPGLGAAWCLTRMMDCRKPSGGFKDNIKTDHVVKGHRLVQPCTADGYTRMDVQCGCNDCYC